MYNISEKFWNILDKAEKNQEKLYQLLYALEREELINFESDFLKARMQICSQRFEDSLGRGRSEDTILDVSEWVISRGKDYYFKILKTPELIAQDLQLYSEAEVVTGVAGEVFEDKFDDEIRYYAKPPV